MANKANIRISFNNILCSGTWSRSGTTITVTFTDHEMVSTQVINVTSIDGSQTVGLKTITVTGANTFTYTGVDSGDSSGSITYRRGTGDTVALSYHDVNTSSFVDLDLISNTVGGQGYFNIGTSNTSCAINYAAALVRDYGISGLISQNNISVSVDDNDVIVEALYYSNTEYGNIDYFEEDDAVWHDMVAESEVLPAASLTITGITYSEAASNPDINIRRTITVTDAVYPVQITSPVSKSCANAGELWFDFARNWTGTISLTDNDSFTDSITGIIVQSLSSISTTITYGSGFANVRITPSLTPTTGTYEPITIQYSLDDVTYQSGNTFYGLFTDDYTAYAIDQYGSQKTSSFSVTVIPDAEKPEPYSSISLNQSLQFREVVARDNYLSFPNMFEDLYCENEFVNREFKRYYQKFKKTDIRNIQIQSTYDTIEADVYSVDDPETSLDTLSFTKMIENIGLTDSRDCIIKSGGDNKTYVYFTSGNTYDYDTGVSNGTYNLGGGLEYWMSSESLQNIQILGSTAMDGQYEVSGYAYDATISASVLIVETTYNGDPSESCIAKFVYNSEDWDIYETTVVFNDYPEGNYFIVITESDTDPRYTDVSYKSEPFEIIETIVSESGDGIVSDNMVLIKWADDKVVNNLDFRTGIENGIRIEGTFYDYSIEGEKEVFDDDDGDIFPIKATKKRIITLKTHDLPPYMMDLISTALCEHKYVLVNGIQVQTKDYPSIESLDQGSTQTLSIPCQVLNTTTYISNDITGENINYNVLGVVYSTSKKILGV